MRLWTLAVWPGSDWRRFWYVNDEGFDWLAGPNAHLDTGPANKLGDSHTVALTHDSKFEFKPSFS